MGRPPSAGAPTKCIRLPSNTGGGADSHWPNGGSLIADLQEQHAQAELLVDGLRRHFAQSARRLEQLHQVEQFGIPTSLPAPVAAHALRPVTPGPSPGLLAEGGSSSSCAPFTTVLPTGQCDGGVQPVPPQCPHPAQRSQPLPPPPEQQHHRHEPLVPQSHYNQPEPPPLHAAWGPLPQLPGQQPEGEAMVATTLAKVAASSAVVGGASGVKRIDNSPAKIERLDSCSSRKLGHRLTSCSMAPVLKKPTLDLFVRSTAFNIFCSCVTLLNAVFVGMSAESQLSHSIAALESQHSSHSRHELMLLNRWIQNVDTIFCAWFTFELLLNISASPRMFVSAENWKWSMFDVMLVLFCVVEFFVADISLPSLNNFRTLRVFRAVRVLRVVKVFKVFRSLRLMVLAIAQSLISLLWVFVLLFLLIYIFSMIFMDAAEQYISEAESVDPIAGLLAEYYGSVLRSCHTLFVAISGGTDWSDVMKPLVAVSEWYRVIFAGYIFFTVFGVLNVVTGAFVDSFAVVSAHDREVVIEDELKREKKYKKDIQAIFQGADADGSGTLSLEEFESHLKDKRVESFFSSLELDVRQARTLFKLLDSDGSNEVGIEEFVHGCLRLKGGAKSVDVHMLLLQNERMMSQVDSLEEYTKANLALLLADKGRSRLPGRGHGTSPEVRSGPSCAHGLLE